MASSSRNMKIPHIPFVRTIGGMIGFGLIEGISMGCLTAWALNCDYGRLRLKEVELPHKQEDAHLKFDRFEFDETFPTITLSWQLKGPINFGSMFMIDDLIHRIEEVHPDAGMTIVLDMQECVGEQEN